MACSYYVARALPDATETELLSASPAATERAGAALTATLTPGAIVLLDGEVGAGKTTFVRGGLRQLGYAGPVTSPTFTLANVYDTAGGQVSHLDLHRLSVIEADDQGLLDDHLTAEAIAFIEWPQVAATVLPRPVVARVVIEHTGDRDTRTIKITRYQAAEL